MWGFGLLLVLGAMLLLILAVRALGGGIARGNRARPSQSPHDATSTDPLQDAPAPPRSQARKILDERYADGRLSTQEYREQLQTLGDDG